MQSLLNYKTINAEVEDKMTSSFFTNFGIFCITWNSDLCKNSIWVKSIGQAIRLFLTLPRSCRGVKVLYFPPDGEVIKVLRRRQ